MSVGVVRATCPGVDDDDGDDDGLVSSFSDCSEMSSLSSTTTEEFGTSNGGTVGSVTTDSGTTPEMKPMKPFSTGFDQISLNPIAESVDEQVSKSEEVPVELIPEPQAPQLERKDIATAKITSNLTSLINVDDKSKSSSFSLPRPSGTFRSVQRPNRKLSNEHNNSSSSKTVPEKPVAMTYADIMAKKRAEQQKIMEEKSKPPPPVVPPPLPQSVDGNHSDTNQDYQNTSDDAESIPISYQEPSSKDSSKQIKFTKKVEVQEEFDDSSISEVHQDLKKDLTNHSRVPSKSRKNLVKKSPTNLDQIPEERSETHDLSQSMKTESTNNEKKREKRRKRRSRTESDVQPRELSQEEKSAHEAKMKAEYEEFVRKQKELEKSEAEERKEKRTKKKKKRKERVEEAKVTDILETCENQIQSYETESSSMTPVQKKRLERLSTFSVKLIKRVAMDSDGNLNPMRALKGLARGESMKSEKNDEPKSVVEDEDPVSQRSMSLSQQDMIDIILPKPVFKWTDPTLVARLSHGTVFKDADYNKIKNNSIAKTLHSITGRVKYLDGKMRGQTWSNLIQLTRGNGLNQNNQMFRLLLEQRSSVPLLLESKDDPTKMVSFVNALKEILVNVGGSYTAINLMHDINLPRIAFISDRNRRERNPKIIEIALNHTVASGTSNVLKSRVFEESFAELGIGFIETNGTYQPWIVLHVGGQYDKASNFVERFADVIVAEGDTYKMHTKNKSRSLHGDEDELDEIIDELSTQLKSFKRFDERISLANLSDDLIHKLFELKGVESLDGAIKSCIPTTTVLRQELNLQQLYKSYMNLRDELCFDSRSSAEKKVEDALLVYQNACKKSRLRGMTEIMSRVLSNDDDEIRVAGYKSFCFILSEIIRDQTSDLHRAYILAANEMQARPCEKNRATFLSKKVDYLNSVISVHHVWREISHIYGGNPRRGKNEKLPTMAAQHLLDGFPMEMQDGESGHLHTKWLTAVFEALIAKIGDVKVFVLSAIGIQSAGKSTLLNTMFGTSFKCGDGMCTKGINIQLVPSNYSKAYDYVLIMDTEGIRAPEFAGRKYAESRDNKMATMSILPSDATIMMTVGDDDSAVKDILPIVMRAYESSSIAEESGITVKPHMTILYKVNNATRDGFSSTLSERLALIESLRQAEDIIREVGVIGDAMEDAVFNSVMSIHKLASKSEVRQGSVASFIQLSTGSDESDDKGNIKTIGQLKTSPNPPDDRPEHSYGSRVQEIRRFIHEQSKSRQPRKLSEWWQLVNDIAGAMSTMDFNFSFKNAIQLRCYNQFKTKEKKLKKDLERALADITNKLEGEANLKSSEPPQLDQVDRIIEGMTEDHRYEMSREAEKFNQQHQSLLNLKNFVPIQTNQVIFAENWQNSVSRMCDTKSYLFKRYITNILKYNHVLSEYEKNFRAELRAALAVNNALANNPEEYRRFFDDEFEKYYKALSADFPIDIDVSLELNRRFKDYEVRLESNEIKRTKCELTSEYYNFITGRDSNYSASFSSVWMTTVKCKKSSKKALTDSSGNVTFHDQTSETDEKTTLMFAAQKLKATMDEVLSECEKYSTEVVDKILYRIHQEINKTTQKHFEALNLFMFVKYHLIQELTRIQTQWETLNNVAERFNSESNREKMWNNFNASCRNLSDFQLILEQLKNELKKGFELGIGEYSAEKIIAVTRNSGAFDTDKIRVEIQKDLLRTAKIGSDGFSDETKDKIIDLIVNQYGLESSEQLRNGIKSSIKDIKNEVSKLILKDISFPAHHYWRIFERLILEQFDFDETKQQLLAQFKQHLTMCVEQANDEETLHLKLMKLAKLISNTSIAELKPVCEYILTNWTHDQTIDSGTALDFVAEIDTVIDKVDEMIGELPRPADSVINKSVRLLFMKQDNESSLARCCAACPVCHGMCLKEHGHLDRHDGYHQPLGLAGISNYKSEQLSFYSCYDVVKKKGWVCDAGFKGLPVNWSSFKNENMFKGWVLPVKEQTKDAFYVLARLLVEFNRQFAQHYNKKENSSESLSAMKDQIRASFGTLDLEKIAKKM